ncbi:S1C family serine protease [Pelomonas sp. KK5]|uniref:S1C family serine protease n=1 Tax=Pelomonas sp. KK5 TaxID=1855730 RepID=UPI00097BD51A|nr:serine protease [Pelomonas sp. KK5]
MSFRTLPVIVCLAAAALLAGCASSTMLVTNTKASDAVKAKSFKSYKEVLLIPPKQDPRKLVPRVAQEIGAMGFQVRTLDPDKPLEAPQGTGFVIDRRGYLLTCAHVLADKTEATVTLGGQRFTADVIKSDSKADLALLKLREAPPESIVAVGFRAAAKPATMGEDVYTIGYPLSRMLGNNARMTRGLLSATTGLRDDDRQVQVSAEIQPGNSGGPLLDHEGNVLGIVSQTINPAAVAQATGGALPQNVNFAIKAAPVLDFLEEADKPLRAGLAFDRNIGFEQAGKAVAKIQAGIVDPANELRADKMVVRFVYAGRWDIWYRFQLFMLLAFDYETQEPLFVAGQARDNMISNEEIVIKDSLAQFQKAVQSR